MKHARDANLDAQNGRKTRTGSDLRKPEQAFLWCSELLQRSWRLLHQGLAASLAAPGGTKHSNCGQEDTPQRVYVSSPGTAHPRQWHRMAESILPDSFCKSQNTRTDAVEMRPR